MLQNIRDKISGWFAWVIIALVAIAFLFWGIEYYIEQLVGAKTVAAKVGHQELSQAQVDAAYKIVQGQALQQQNGAPLTQEQTVYLKQYALQALINETVLVQAALKAGFDVSNTQLKMWIMSDPSLQENGHFSAAKFQQLLIANGINTSQFMQRLEGSVVTQQVQGGLQNTAILSPMALKQIYAYTNETRDFSVAELKLSTFSSKVKVPLSAVKQYYEQNRSQFQTPEKVKVSYLLLSPSHIADSIQISEDSAKAYYTSHQSNFVVPKRWKILEIHGSTASQAAWVNNDEVQPKLADLLNSLSVGQQSSLIQTAKGPASLRLLAVENAQVKPYAQVRSQIYRAIREQTLDQLLSQKNDQLSNLTYTNPNTLAPAAKALNIPIQTTTWLTSNGEKDGVFADPSVLATIFSDDVLQQGNNSNPVTLKNGSVVVVRVSAHEVSTPLALSAVETKIHQTLVLQQAQTLAGLTAYQVQQALQKGESLNTVAKKYALTWQTHTAVNRHATLNKDLLKLAFNTPSKQMANQINYQGDYVLVFVNSVHLANADKAKPAVLKALAKDAAQLYGQIEYQLYVKSVTDKTPIKIFH